MGLDLEDRPLVSIITPFINAEQFLKESIESVLNQTYDNWELMLVDDGSSDGSINIAKHYAFLHPNKIFYLEHEEHKNLGASASRNLGIKLSMGEYIAFLDSDDVYLPNKLEKQVALLKEQPKAGMLYSSNEYWYSWTGLPEDAHKDWIWDYFGVQANTLIMPPELLKIFLRKKGTIPAPVSVMARRRAVESVGGWENSFKNLYDDQVFYAKICLKWPVFISSGCWDRYRQHPNSLCSAMSKPNQKLMAKYKYMKWLEKYLIENNVNKDHDLWNALIIAKRVDSRFIKYYIANNYNNLKVKLKYNLKPILRNLVRSYNQFKIKYLRVGKAEFGNLRRVTPLSRKFGFDRGLPIDRYYIANFLHKYSEDIRGCVLEIGEATYTRKFGGEKVTQSDVLYVVEGNPEATIVGDLTRADHIESNYFDCIILTQTLHLIYDIKSAAKTLFRILKPGGILLLTVPGISQVVRSDWGDNWYWAFTDQSAQQLFEGLFGKTNVQVESHGNILAAIAFLHGIAVEELTEKELDYHDHEYQVTITVRTVKKVANI